MANVLLCGVFVTFLSLNYFGRASSWPSGAPAGSCASMAPGHGPLAQDGPSPYSIHVNRTWVAPGEGIEVVLKTTGSPFKGFLARGSEDKGQFQAAGDMLPIFGGDVPNIHTVMCPTGAGITHADAVKKMEVKFQWKAPNAEGNYVILATFVKGFNTFWVKQSSDVIKVGTSAQA